MPRGVMARGILFSRFDMCDFFAINARILKDTISRDQFLETRIRVSVVQDDVCVGQSDDQVYCSYVCKTQL